MKFLDICAGIGGFRAGFEKAGHECVGFVEYNENAVRSYKAIHNTEGEFYHNDITTVKTEDLPDADGWCFGFPCFVEGTKITTSKGYKNVEDIVKGDMVLTHKQRLRSVVKPMVRETKEVYNLKIQGSVEHKTTEEHPYLVNRSGVIDWVKVKDLETGDLVGFPINIEEKLPMREGSNLDFGSEDFWWIVGLYVAAGTVDAEGVVINCSIKDVKAFRARNKGVFESYFDLKGFYGKLYIKSVELRDYVNQFGYSQKNKDLSGDVINLPKHLIKAFLRGYLDTKGRIVGNNEKFDASTLKLALGLQACIHKVEQCLCTIYKQRVLKPGFGGAKYYFDQYELSYSLEKKGYTKWFHEEGYIWTPVKDKQLIKGSGKVYNFEVEEDNSYVANNIAVHNCQDISIGGNKLGFNGSRSSIYLDIIELLAAREFKNRPRWLFIENVKHLLSIDGGWLFKTVLSELERVGYDVEWEILNSKDFGVPQNRERVYLVGYLRGECRRGILPFARGGRQAGVELSKVRRVSNIFDTNDAKYTSQSGRVYDSKGLSPTLICGCNDYIMIRQPDGTRRVRKLTPRESFRLQGFTDEQFDRVKDINSKTQLYKQAGNAVTVNITYEIGKRWAETAETPQFDWM